MASDDLYFEVLSALTGRWDEDDAIAARAALRAVVELHAPDVFMIAGLPHAECIGCDEVDEVRAAWPCSTIRTIAEALGVPLEGDR